MSTNEERKQMKKVRLDLQQKPEKAKVEQDEEQAADAQAEEKQEEEQEQILQRVLLFPETQKFRDFRPQFDQLMEGPLALDVAIEFSIGFEQIELLKDVKMKIFAMFKRAIQETEKI